MKKPLSNLTPQQFIEIMAALGTRPADLALLIGRSRPSVSQYSTGAKAITQEVADKLNALLAARAGQLNRLLGQQLTPADVGPMIQHTNTMNGAREAVSTRYRLLRRLRPDTRLYPPYRLPPTKVLLYAQALAAWRDECERRMRAIVSTDSMVRAYKLELADVRVLYESVPKSPPHELVLSYSEWEVVSRALRWYYAIDKVGHAPAYAFYQHWRKHKGCGYPVEMMRERQRAEGAAA